MKKKSITYSEGSVAVLNKKLEETEQEIAKLAEIWKAELKEEKNLPCYKRLFG